VIFRKGRLPPRIEPGTGGFRITVEGALNSKLLQDTTQHLDVERLGCNILFDIEPEQCGVANGFRLPTCGVALTREEDLERAAQRSEAAQEIANGLAAE
jgi:hypothetical protein